MSGIAGIAGLDRDDLRPLLAMTRALAHRGPDDEGYLVADTRRTRVWPFGGSATPPEVLYPKLPATLPEGANLGFGHRRLAIVDLSAAGHGPMPYADGRLWITCSGRLYDYVELRTQLRA